MVSTPSNPVTYLTIVCLALSVVGGKLAASTTEQRVVSFVEAIAAPVSGVKGLLSIVAFGGAILAGAGQLSPSILLVATGGGVLAAASTAVLSRARPNS